ncbi:hypothetical protein [Jannaschia formosa]|uniref:hypothetical protein n=1 Tax=Jannaschia formosa TaxID=2259592 RepID=UPI00143001C6|nr:hypothetical protein [Jannaschia formosa]
MDQAEAAFARAAEIAPPFVGSRLAGRWLTSNPDDLARAHAFFRVAAGLVPTDMDEMLR